MRVKRQRIFRITISGKQGWTEEAGSRSIHEYQHFLSLQHPGASVKVQEQYLGGAKAKEVPDEEELE